jgi:hypothetical protein
MKEIADAIDAGELRGTCGKESGSKPTQVPSGAINARHLGRKYIQQSGSLKSEKWRVSK